MIEKIIALLLTGILFATGFAGNHETKGSDEVFSYMNLVELQEMDPTFIVDCRYATENNFTGQVLYETPLVLVHKDIADTLLEINKKLRKDGYTLVLYDVYRPISVQQKLYDSTPAELKAFVAKPSGNAVHCKGLAVDCGLANLSGEYLPMPSGYDEFTTRAYADYTGGTQEERDNRDYLIQTMKSFGFNVYSKEWWHFIYPNHGKYETLDISMTEFITQRNLSME